MSRLFLLILALLAGPAQAQNSPCYWSGQLVKCLPTTGIYLDARRSVRYGDATTNYVELKAGASVTTYTLTLPTVQGGSGTTLSNNGSGVLTWVTAGTGTVTSVSGTAPILVTGTTAPTVSITQSAAGTDGYLSSTDWGTFNGKQASGSYVTTARTISTTTPLAGGGDLSADRTFTIPAATSAANGYLSTTDWTAFNSISRVTATTSVNGYLSSTDWTTFNGRTPAARTISTTAPLAGGGTLAADRTFTIPAATTSADGYLSSTDWTAFNSITRVKATSAVNGYLSTTDWTTFNGKQATVSVTAPVTFTSNTVALPKATSSVDGYLASTDWTTFNGKQASLGVYVRAVYAGTFTGTIVVGASSTSFTVATDLGSNMASSVFTAPAAGRYLVTNLFNISTSTGSPTALEFVVQVNDADNQNRFPRIVKTLAANDNGGGSVVLNLAASDTVKMKVIVTGGTNITFDGAGYSTITITRIQ